MNIDLDKEGYDRVKLALKEAQEIQAFATEEASKYITDLKRKRDQVNEQLEELNSKLVFGTKLSPSEQEAYDNATAIMNKISKIGMNIQKMLYDTIGSS